MHFSLLNNHAVIGYVSLRLAFIKIAKLKVEAFMSHKYNILIYNMM